MTRFLAPFRICLLAAAATVLAPAAACAWPFGPEPTIGGITGSGQSEGARSKRAEVEDEAPYVVAAADCSGAAGEAAAQTGGQVLSVSSRSEGGQTVCVVTVLIPGQDGERPRKTTITIRQ